MTAVALESPGGNSKVMTKILVVEDDATVRALLLKLLTAEGFEVASGADGREGIHLAQTQFPDLIICDVMMPECNGYEVLDALRQNPTTASIPFIFLSAKADRTDLRHGMDLGADDYLTKPFKRAELLGAIAARLAKQSSITQPYIQEMKRAAQSLGQIAYRDPLTNLPNRIFYHSQLQEATQKAQRAGQMVAILCINLSRFKRINENLGYSNGDLLLRLAAERLSETFPPPCVVARIGGDEFSVLLPEVDSPAMVERHAQVALRRLTEVYTLADHSVQIQVQVGGALYPQDCTNPDQLLTRAETAMRYAKSQSSSKYQLYNTDMEILVAERQVLEARLREALARQEFELYYQPQVNLITRRIIGAEALIRWQPADLGPVSPSKFVGIAEETGLIVPLGEWVLRTACAHAKAWQDSSQLPIRVSVNLSARQFKQQNLPSTVEAVLHETGFNPDLLILELTETSVMEDVDATVITLRTLRKMGVHISIDDFGTGYSSLNYLKRFPINTLKIDQSFIRDITTDTNDAAIAKAIIAMAQSLQLKVVAEGVEHEDQFVFLKQIGCHAMQGFLFSPPLQNSAFEQLLNQDKRL
jgi:diguanylate cyclase